MARPHGPWTINDNDTWMLWTGQYVLERCTTAIHGTSFTWTSSWGSSYLGLYVADSEEYNPGWPRCADQATPPTAWHGRCTTTRSDIRSLLTTLVWYHMAGECLPKPAETDRQLPPGTIATSGKCLLASTIGQPRRSIYSAMAGKSSCSSLGAPGPSHQHRPFASCCHTLSHGIGHQPASSPSKAAAQRQRRLGQSRHPPPSLPSGLICVDNSIRRWPSYPPSRSNYHQDANRRGLGAVAYYRAVETCLFSSRLHLSSLHAHQHPEPQASLVGKVVRTPSPGPHRASPSRLHQQLGMPCNVQARC